MQSWPFQQAWHLATDCPATYTNRLEIFGEGRANDWSVARLRRFLEIPYVESITTTRVDSEQGDPDWWFSTGMR